MNNLRAEIYYCCLKRCVNNNCISFNKNATLDSHLSLPLQVFTRQLSFAHALPPSQPNISGLVAFALGVKLPYVYEANVLGLINQQEWLSVIANRL